MSIAQHIEVSIGIESEPSWSVSLEIGSERSREVRIGMESEPSWKVSPEMGSEPGWEVSMGKESEPRTGKWAQLRGDYRKGKWA
jgi:hypothetical protein